MMHAKMRLYLTVCSTALVAEGDPRGASLYAAPGDEIPDAAAARFGLIDGALPDDGPVPAMPVPDSSAGPAILRVAVKDGGAPREVAGFRFLTSFYPFAAGDLDEAQLLEMLKDDGLTVEVMQFADDEAKDWGDVPGREAVIAALQEHVDYDIAHGLPHDRVGVEPLRDDAVPQPDGDKPGSEPGPAPEQKEAKSVEDKEAKPAPTKGAKAPKTSGRVKPATGQD